MQDKLKINWYFTTERLYLFSQQYLTYQAYRIFDGTCIWHKRNKQYQEHGMSATLLHLHFAVFTPSGNVTWFTLIGTFMIFISLLASVWYRCYHTVTTVCVCNHDLWEHVWFSLFTKIFTSSWTHVLCFYVLYSLNDTPIKWQELSAWGFTAVVHPEFNFSKHHSDNVYCLTAVKYWHIFDIPHTSHILKHQWNKKESM
jgi:hypothetical protein